MWFLKKNKKKLEETNDQKILEGSEKMWETSWTQKNENFDENLEWVYRKNVSN